jgi:hypothetical protein
MEDGSMVGDVGGGERSSGGEEGGECDGEG